jgi:S1-C subfamily serine protease
MLKLNQPVVRHDRAVAFGCGHRLALVCFLAVCMATPMRGDDLSEKGREIFTRNQHAVVTVQLVQKRSSRGRQSEVKQDITGTVVDPSGLTVLALSACDPYELYRRMLPDETSLAETEISDVKILLEDGTELPSEIVLRDKDLDLAFIRPKTKPASPMTAVDLSKSTQAQVLDQVITLNRLNPAASRAYAASFERITAVIQKPRTFYIPDSAMTATGRGSPVFGLDGSMLGVVVMRAVVLPGGAQGDPREGMVTVILPAADVLKGAKQAPEAKGDSDKKETSKEKKTEGSTDAKDAKGDK